ncbi:uncharacterized protein LOC135845411 [Planococcus citri]|uniref:uncharacterized protein LOC135845411 n=1 Tax=Planococcus citri TaxID=170843 RepID=UPI0031F8B694
MSDDHDPSNGTLVFWTHAGKLVDLASVSVMASLMHLKTTLIRCGNKEIKVNTVETDLIHATLPETIIKKIRAVSHRMNVSRVKWWKYHWKRVFFRNMPSDDLIALFDHLVWLHDGSISFEQTARKLLDSDNKLTNVQKFQIACTYYFIDDVNRLKEKLSPDEIHLATESFCTDVDPFLEYLCCKIRHMTGRYLTSTNINFFIELIKPICRKYYNHWPVVEYFWEQSGNEEERLKKAKEIIYSASSGTPELIWHLLPKLTSSQLDSMIMENGYEIMLYFAKKSDYIEYTMLTWKRVVNLINDDDLNCILRSVTDMEKSRDYVNSLLREMWLYMSEQQKKFIANQQEFDYVEKLFERGEGEYNSPNYQLIFDVFMLWDSERRHKYWTANWANLVIGQMKHKNKIDEMMKIIFDNNENIAAFKGTVMTDYNTIIAYCEVLLNWGHFQEFQDYLNFCTEDQDVIRILKKQIITSMLKDDLFYELYDCCDDKERHAKFECFLRDIFTVDEMKNFQNDVVMGSLEKIEEMLRSGSVHQIIRCIEKYLSSEEDLCTMKLHLFKYSREHHDLTTNIKMADWAHFLSWCLDGSNSLTKRFKSSLQPTEAKVSDDVEMKELSLYESFCKHF